jgi:hypothetical protein
MIVGCADVDVLLVGRTPGIQSCGQRPDDRRCRPVQGGVRQKVMMLGRFKEDLVAE